MNYSLHQLRRSKKITYSPAAPLSSEAETGGMFEVTLEEVRKNLETQKNFSFRHPTMASEAPGGGRQGKPKFVAGPDPAPAGLPGPERGHCPL